MSFIAELAWRGLIHQSSDPTLAERMEREKLTLYIGFDPSAPSLHVGSLLPILALRRAQDFGHQPIALVGGATGMVGDPSFKTEERALLGAAELEHNLAGIRAQLERFLDFAPGKAMLVNNADWFRDLKYLDFLRDIGKHFSVNMMLAKESVRARLEDRAHGISYTEFSYMLVQAYDFLRLHEDRGCRLQLGGSDQWGNITAGIELIRRVRGQEAFGLTMPLITTATGQKLGKTERGAVWLDAERTKPEELYHHFVNVADRDIGRFLRYFTFLQLQEIEAWERTVETAPWKREAHHELAYQVTKLVHGEAEAERCRHEAKSRSETRALEKGALQAALSAGNIVPDIEDARLAILEESGIPLVELLVSTGLCSSKSDARRQVEQEAIYVNNQGVDDPGMIIKKDHLLLDWGLHLRRGKKQIRVVRFT